VIVIYHATFLSGICDNARKVGHDNEGVLMLCLIIFLSNDAEKLEEEVGREVLSNFICLIEILIMLEEFLNCCRFARKDLHRFKDYSRSILDQFKQTYDRKHGAKRNLIKLHLLLYFANEILNNGPALGCDSGCGEHGHILKQRLPKSHKEEKIPFIIKQEQGFLRTLRLILPPIISTLSSENISLPERIVKFIFLLTLTFPTRMEYLTRRNNHISLRLNGAVLNAWNMYFISSEIMSFLTFVMTELNYIPNSAFQYRGR
jgi:hypothetical protein